MTDEEKPKGREGWGKSYGRKWHYFVIKEGCYRGESLCGKIGFYSGETEQGNDDSLDNCAKCKRLLAKRRS